MNNRSVFKQLAALAYLPVYYKLLKGAVELDVFSCLQNPAGAEELAAGNGWDRHNTVVLLNGLVSIGFLEKRGNRYMNTEEAQRYLVSSSSDYAGGFLKMFLREDGLSFDAAELVMNGPDPDAEKQMEQSLDFTQYKEAFRSAQKGCRQQEVLRIVRALPENERIRKILDLGCNTGLLGLAVIADAPGRTGVLQDMPSLCPLIEESIRLEGLEGRACSLGGNFLTDDMGSGYDLILAVSVMLFAKKDMTGFLKKMYDALAPEGVMVCIGEGIESDFSGPWDMIMGYLPYWFQEKDLAVRSGEIEAAARLAGFGHTSCRSELLCSGTQEIVILRK